MTNYDADKKAAWWDQTRFSSLSWLRCWTCRVRKKNTHCHLASLWTILTLGNIKRQSKPEGWRRRQTRTHHQQPASGVEVCRRVFVCIRSIKRIIQRQGRQSQGLIGLKRARIAAQVSLDLHYKTLCAEMTLEEGKKKNQFIVLVWLKPDF